MRIFCVLVTKDEVRRYLSSHLLWHSWLYDGIAVYDDQSEDETAEVARTFGAQVQVRPDAVPSFTEHEGQFRGAAWSWFEESLQPLDGDWVIALDADEFLVSTEGDPMLSIFRAIMYAEYNGFNCISLPIPEVFAVIDNVPQIRTDGFWKNLTGPRLFRYSQGGFYADKAMACGSAPTYLGDPSPVNRGTTILHYGYARDEDRRLKFERYSSLRHNHNPQHIYSILQHPTLEPWAHKYPKLDF